MKVKVTQSCRTLCDPMDCIDSPARILEWVAIPFSRGCSQPRNRTAVSCIAGGFFTGLATREAPRGRRVEAYWLDKCTQRRARQFLLFAKIYENTRKKREENEAFGFFHCLSYHFRTYRTFFFSGYVSLAHSNSTKLFISPILLNIYYGLGAILSDSILQ